jgi:hypothetical protein
MSNPIEPGRALNVEAVLAGKVFQSGEVLVVVVAAVRIHRADLTRA